ncbi:MAG: D-alanine--D-alanine ligase [Fluviicola sp.]|nr:D-alanine--D-alanine ligase [Fluviicola sp.]
MKTVGLFCGGFSSEFDISMKSAQTIVDNFPSTYTIVKIEVTKAAWFVHLPEGKVPFNMETLSFSDAGSETKIDIGLIYIHGNPGENGKIQAYLDMKGLPYVNSGALASELSFDKWYCNQFLSKFGVRIAESVFMTSRTAVDEATIIAQLGLPCFVKPSDSGSSYGISRVNTADALGAALDKAFAEGGTVIVEAFLDGTEVTCGIYRRHSGLHALPLTEIASDNDFFDYEAKYLGQSQEITPARIEDTVRDQVWEVARKCYQLLQLKSIARIDFMIVNNVPYLIEVNTTPGFSAASIVPQMLAADGISIHDFWKEIMEVEL